MRSISTRRQHSWRVSIIFLTLLAMLGSLFVSAMVNPNTKTASAASTGTKLVDESFQGADFQDSANWSSSKTCFTGVSLTSSNGCLTKGLLGTTPMTPFYNLGDPATKTGYLQLTPNQPSQNGTVLYNNAIPSDQGLEVSFTSYMFGADKQTPGDGISFFLTDGTATLDTPGPEGAGLGYATKVENGSTTSGIAYGVLGVGFDRYGNFSVQDRSKSPSVGGSDCTQISGSATPEAVSIRGKGDLDSSNAWTQGYCLLNTTKVADKGAALNTPDSGPSFTDPSGGKRITVRISPTNSSGFQSVTVLIDGVEIISNEELDYQLPKIIKFGLSGSTGRAANEYHLIRDLTASTVNDIPAVYLTKQLNKDALEAAGITDGDNYVFKAGDTVPYTFTITNGGLSNLSNLKLSDPLIESNNKDLTCYADDGSTFTGSLAIGKTISCKGSLTLTEDILEAEVSPGELMNTATVTANSASGAITPNTDSFTIKTQKVAVAIAASKFIQKDSTATSPRDSYTLNWEFAISSTLPSDTSSIPYRHIKLVDALSEWTQPASATLSSATGTTTPLTVGTESSNDIQITTTKLDDGSETGEAAAITGITATYDGATKTISVAFPPDYNYNDAIVYSLRFRIRPAQAAYNTYALSQRDPSTPSGEITADPGTAADPNQSTTGYAVSQPGAVIEYCKNSNMEADGTCSSTSNLALAMPVVQVKDTSITVSKKWAIGSADAPDTSVTITLKSSDPATPAMTTILSKADNWTATFNHVAPNNDAKYTIEEAPIDGYISSVKYSATADGATSTDDDALRISTDSVWTTPATIYAAEVTNTKASATFPTKDMGLAITLQNAKPKFQQFSLTLSAAADDADSKTSTAIKNGDVVLPGGGANTSAANDADGKVDFGSISFLAAGTYKFDVKQDTSYRNGPEPDYLGVIYDEGSTTLTITVVKAANGALSIDSSGTDFGAKDTWKNTSVPVVTKLPLTGADATARTFLIASLLFAAIMGAAAVGRGLFNRRG